MKVLHICMACIYTEGYNYQENYLIKYHSQKYETYLITNEFMFNQGDIVKSNENNYINKDGVRVRRLKYKYAFLNNKINRFLGIYKDFFNTIDSINPDIVFIHNCQFVDIKQIVKYCKNNRIRVYVDNHADFSNSAKNIISKIIHKTLWRRCAQKIEPYTTKFYGVLPARVDFLKNVYKLPEKKVDLLVMGADDDKVIEVENNKVRDAIRKKHRIDDGDFLIMTGGKIDEWKTQTLLLMQAVNRINNPKIKLIVFGSVTQELKEQVNKLTNGLTVQYIGWINSDESYEYWSAADLAVFPGRHSVFWEQVVGMGIPMVCKYWDGTTHIDIGGNVKYLYKDSVEEIIEIIDKIVYYDYEVMQKVANSSDKNKFLYSNISMKSIDCYSV